MKEVKQKFEEMPLFSADALEDGCAEFSELLLVETAGTHKDLMKEYNEV